MSKDIFKYALKTGNLIRNKKSNIIYKLKYKKYWDDYVAVSQKSGKNIQIYWRDNFELFEEKGMKSIEWI